MTRPSAVLQRIENAAEGKLSRLQHKASVLFDGGSSGRTSRRRATSRRHGGPIISAPLNSRDVHWPATPNFQASAAHVMAGHQIPSPAPLVLHDPIGAPQETIEVAEDGLPAPPHAVCEFIDVFAGTHDHDPLASEEKHLALQLLHKASSNLGDALFALDEVALIYSSEDCDERRGREASKGWKGPSTIEELKMLRQAVAEVHRAFSMGSFEVSAEVHECIGLATSPPKESHWSETTDDSSTRMSCSTQLSHTSQYSSSQSTSRTSISSQLSAATGLTSYVSSARCIDSVQSQPRGWKAQCPLGARGMSGQGLHSDDNSRGSVAASDGVIKIHRSAAHFDAVTPLELSGSHQKPRPRPREVRHDHPTKEEPRLPHRHRDTAKPTLAARRLSRKQPPHLQAQRNPVSPLRIGQRAASVPTSAYILSPIHLAVSEQVEVLRSPMNATVELLLTPQATEINQGVARARANIECEGLPSVSFVLGPYEGLVKKEEARQHKRKEQSALNSPPLRRTSSRRKPSTIIAGRLCDVPVSSDDDGDGFAATLSALRAINKTESDGIEDTVARHPALPPSPWLSSGLTQSSPDLAHNEFDAAHFAKNISPASQAQMSTGTKIKPLHLCRRAALPGIVVEHSAQRHVPVNMGGMI